MTIRVVRPASFRPSKILAGPDTDGGAYLQAARWTKPPFG